MKRRRLGVVVLVLLVSACTSKGGASAPAPAKAPAEAKPAAPAKPVAATPKPVAPAKPVTAPPKAAAPKGSVAVVNFKATAKHPAKKAAPKTPPKAAPKAPAKVAPKAPAPKAAAKAPPKAAATAPPKAAAPSPALVAAGKKVWARHCHICHRDGSRTEFLHHEMPDLTSAAFQKTVTDADLETRITHGYGKPKPSGKRPMPAFAHKLSAKDIGAVVAYVRSLRK